MREQTDLCGVLLLDKPAGVTSHDMVGFVRRMYGTRQVGHAGTLDPMATGVLPVMVGRMTKLSSLLSDHDKRYQAFLTLGLMTDTGDITGQVLTRSALIPDRKAVEMAVSSFSGPILQVPPMVSAIKRNGQKLVDLARKGVEVAREPREVIIHSISCQPTDDPSVYRLDVYCGKGTYIRTLCEDIGAKLGCGGTMSALRRTAVDRFSIEQCVTKDCVESADPDSRIRFLLSPEQCFPDWPAFCPPPFYERLLKNGCAVRTDKIGLAHITYPHVLLVDSSGICYAVADILPGEDGPVLKIHALLRLDPSGTY